VASRISLSQVRVCKGLADGGWPPVLLRMRSQGIGDCRDDLRPQQNPAPRLVCLCLVYDQPKARSKCAWTTAIVGTGELSNRMDHLAEVAHGHGAARAGSTWRCGRGR